LATLSPESGRDFFKFLYSCGLVLYIQKNERRSIFVEKVVVINSDKMGQGDEELGVRLVANFLSKLIDAQSKPQMLVLYNSGVRLAARGSPVLESLQSLENLGIEIICCGTCVNYYGLTDQMEAGMVTNMPEIVKILTEAKSTVTI
jgi:selenium metabolism protein YedF